MRPPKGNDVKREGVFAVDSIEPRCLRILFSCRAWRRDRHADEHVGHVMIY